MAFNTPLAKSENYVFGRGILYLAIVAADGTVMGERDLGNTPGFTLSVATDRFQHTSSRSGLAKTDLDIPIKTTLSAKITIEDMSPENQALFIAGSTRDIAQASGSVTGEEVKNAAGGFEYQLGTTAGNLSGVRGISAVAVKTALGGAATRVNSTAYAVGDVFKSTTNVFVVTVAGTTAASAPSFVTTNVGDTTVDGTATVAYVGTTTDTYTVTTDYIVSAESGRIGIVAGGKIDLVSQQFPSDALPSVLVDYTRAANSRTQVISSGGGSTSAQLRFIADNAEGDNRDLLISSCSVSASGDNPFITENAISSFTLDVGINEKDSSTPQIVIDGRPV